MNASAAWSAYLGRSVTDPLTRTRPRVDEDEDGSLDVDPTEAKFPGWKAPYVELLQSTVRREPMHPSLAKIPKDDVAELEAAITDLFLEKDGLSYHMREVLAAVAYPILLQAVPRVEGKIGGILMANPSFQDWITLTREPKLRWLVMLRTAMQVAKYTYEPQIDTPQDHLQLWMIWSRRFFDRIDPSPPRSGLPDYIPPVQTRKDKERVLHNANDPVLDILYWASDSMTEKSGVGSPRWTQSAFNAAIEIPKPTALTFLVVHGFINHYNAEELLAYAIGKADADAVTMMASNYKAYALTEAQRASIHHKLHTSNLPRDLVERLLPRFA